MSKIAVRKSDKRIVSFGTEDMSRFSSTEFDIFETDLEILPDELRFCEYQNGEIVVDEILKEDILNKEMDIVKKRQDAREYLRTSNPADIHSLPALIERVKRLEALLEIYEWI